jgi:hypothetical protein
VDTDKLLALLPVDTATSSIPVLGTVLVARLLAGMLTEEQEDKLFANEAIYYKIFRYASPTRHLLLRNLLKPEVKAIVARLHKMSIPTQLKLTSVIADDVNAGTYNYSKELRWVTDTFLNNIMTENYNLYACLEHLSLADMLDIDCAVTSINFLSNQIKAATKQTDRPVITGTIKANNSDFYLLKRVRNIKDLLLQLTDNSLTFNVVLSFSYNAAIKMKSFPRELRKNFVERLAIRFVYNPNMNIVTLNVPGVEYNSTKVSMDVSDLPKLFEVHE